jgi:hypothetical protein
MGGECSTHGIGKKCLSQKLNVKEMEERYRNKCNS